MATLVLTAAGNALGGPIGSAIGAIIGQAIDARLFAPKARQGPRLGDLSVQTSTYGAAIPKLFGTMRVAGTVIWSTDLVESRSTGGGGKGRAATVDYAYKASFAVALSARRIIEVRRIWADGKLLRGAGGDFKTSAVLRLHVGDEDQEPDPQIVAAEGVGQAPAFRGIAYALIEDMALADYGNRIPSLTFEVVADAEPVEIGAVAMALAPGIADAGGTLPLAGYAASGDSVRGAIEDIAGLAGLGLVDDGDALSLGAEAGEAVAIDRADESGRRSMVRQAAGQTADAVTITYYDAARDYQAGLQRAAAGPVSNEARVERRGLPAVLDAAGALALAEMRLDRIAAERMQATIGCGWRRADIRPGQLVRIHGDAATWKVRRWTLGAMRVTLDLVRIGGGGAGEGAASPGRPVSEPDLPHGATLLRLYDLPLAEAGEAGRATLLAFAAGALPGWRRAMLSVSFDGGASIIDVGPTAGPAVIGSVTGVLGAAGTALFDRTSSIEVELVHDEMVLESRDEDALVAGANLALIGEELVQFAVAEPLEPGRYRLSRFLRGRRGTEWAAGAHEAGEDFALVEAGRARAIAVPIGMAGGTEMRVLAAGVGDTEPAEAIRIARGEALLPPAPVHAAAESDGAGGFRLSWVRRSRAGWTWASGADTSIGEESERYMLTFTGSAGARSVETVVPAYDYDAAARAVDGGGAAIIEIVQIGTHGASRPAILTIS